MIDRNNIKLDFLRMQGQQLYRITKDKEFSFAYHPWNTSVAPEIGYLIKSDDMLKKIFHVKKSKSAKDYPTVILHIVFEDQYYLYDQRGSPFSYKKSNASSTVKPQSNIVGIVNPEIHTLNGDLTHIQTFDHTKKDSQFGIQLNQSEIADGPSTTK